MTKPFRDPTKCYDADGQELKPGDTVTITGTWLDQAKTDVGADSRIRLLPTPTGFCPIVAVHSSQLKIVGD